MLLRVVAALVGALPWRALRFLGAALGALAGSLLRVRRGHVEASMRAARIAAVAASARAMYASLGVAALELLLLSRRGAAALEHVRVDAGSEAAWRAALGGGRGVVVAASHTGNWDLAACAVARDAELLVVTKRLHVRALDAFWQSTRAGLGVRLVEAHGAMARARETLRRGGAVAMMIDQAPASARGTVEVTFLGQRALVDRAPAALAASTGAPLVVAAARREASGEHVLHVLAVLSPPGAGGRVRAWVDDATRAATAALDAFVRAHPDQWLWLHRRWIRAAVPADGVPKRAILPPPCSSETTASPSPDAGSRAA